MTLLHSEAGLSQTSVSGHLLQGDDTPRVILDVCHASQYMTPPR